MITNCSQKRGLLDSKGSASRNTNHNSKSVGILPMLLVLLSCMPTVSAGLFGAGYREQELQVAKGTTFNSEKPTGIPYASFAGDTNIFIKGDGLEDGA